MRMTPSAKMAHLKSLALYGSCFQPHLESQERDVDKDGLRSDSQSSLFESRPASFEGGWQAAKWAGAIHNRWKVMARFETGWVDGFKTG